MSKEKISSQEIVELVSSKASVSKRAAEEFLKVMIATIEETLQAGDIVKIKGFGTFKLLWVEPRKSVNVNTKEEIILDGYYKVSFTPEASLKELVNEPFAHLMAVSVDEPAADVDPEPEGADTATVLDPLRIFEEQASEIKSLLSEIQALSNSPRTEKTEDTLSTDSIQDYDLADYIVEEEPQIVSTHSEPVEPEYIPTVALEPVVEVDSSDDTDAAVLPEKEYTPLESIQLDAVVETPAAELDADVMDIPRRKRSAWLWVWIIALLVLAGTYAVYFYYLPFTNAVDNAYLRAKVYVDDTYQGFAKTAGTDQNNIKSPTVKGVVSPSDSLALPSADSLQLLFDNPRVYTTFIGTERIVLGSRLARMAERYYGKSDFWVYIYEANKNVIKHPDAIVEGTIVKIPKLDSRLIDDSNPRCIQKAKELHDLYVNK